MAIALFLLWLAGIYRTDTTVNPNLTWWLTRPFAILGPLACTLPVIWLFGRRWVRARDPDGLPAAVPARID
jgi:hypothetical protein